MKNDIQQLTTLSMIESNLYYYYTEQLSELFDFGFDYFIQQFKPLELNNI